MKPIHIFLIFAISLILTICFVRACQEDYDSEQTQESISDANVDDHEQSIGTNTNSDIVTTWPDSIYNIVADVSYLSQLDKDVIIEINKCRTNPSRYAEEVLVPFKNRFTSSNMYIDEDGFNIRTEEGITAVEEAIEALLKRQPQPMLRPKQYLCLAAADHCSDQGPTGYIGHGGSDGSSPMMRVLRHTKACNGVGENIAYGDSKGVGIIRGLIIDDGVPDRGHRENTFHNYRYVGTAFGKHKTFRYMCVIDFEL